MLRKDGGRELNERSKGVWGSRFLKGILDLDVDV